MNKHERVVILGAGVAGLAAACRLKEEGIEAVIYEQEETYGGLCNSFYIDGFTFDTFAHISFDKSTTGWLEETTDYLNHEPEALNYEKGRWLRHPVQNNLIGLPVEERVELIQDYIERNREKEPQNYGEWLCKAYGKKFAERYPYKYTRKYWTVDPEKLETKWIRGRMYEPKLEEVLRGAMLSNTPGVHYSKEAHYPVKGGFKAFLKFMASECNIKYSKKVCKIDTNQKKVEFEDGSLALYTQLISTIPLPEICGCMSEITDNVKACAKNLEYTTGVMLSLGFNKPNISPALWYYIYDEEIMPARIYAPDWKSPNNVPRGCSAIQAEIYFSSHKPMMDSLERIMDKGINQMLQLNLFKREDIIVKDIRMKQYANVMFTPYIYENRERIHKYLDDKKICYAGRFGEWDYLWVGQSLCSGRNAADKCIKEMRIKS